MNALFHTDHRFNVIAADAARVTASPSTGGRMNGGRTPDALVVRWRR